MTTWLILMMFWSPDGSLHMQTRRGLPTAEHCAQALKFDVAEFQRQFPSVRGQCIEAPPRPAGLPEPVERSKGRDA